MTPLVFNSFLFNNFFLSRYISYRPLKLLLLKDLTVELTRRLGLVIEAAEELLHLLGSLLVPLLLQMVKVSQTHELVCLSARDF